MRTCRKRSYRSNTRTATKCESCEKRLQLNKDSGEGFADSFSYFGKILQKGKGGWREKHLTNTVTEHRVRVTHLTHGPSILADEGGSLFNIRKTFHGTCKTFQREATTSVARKPWPSFVHTGNRVVVVQENCLAVLNFPPQWNHKLRPLDRSVNVSLTRYVNRDMMSA